MAYSKLRAPPPLVDFRLRKVQFVISISLDRYTCTAELSIMASYLPVNCEFVKVALESEIQKNS